MNNCAASGLLLPLNGQRTRLHLLEHRHQHHTQDNQINAQVLRNRRTFVDYPPAILKWVVVSEELDEEPGNAVEYEHEGERAAGPGEEFLGIL